MNEFIKKISILVFFFLNLTFSYSQSNLGKEYERELSSLKVEEQTELSKVTEIGQGADALKSSIRTKYQEKENSLFQKYSKGQSQKLNVQQYSENDIVQLKTQQYNYQSNYNQSISRTMNNISNELMNTANRMAIQGINDEINRRSRVANNFYNDQSSRINKIFSIYSQIPKANFLKTVDGMYRAHFLTQKKYSFINNQEVITEIPCYVLLENNVIKDIFLYGKKDFKLNYPERFPQSSLLSNGIVKYVDYDNLETVTIIVIDPYINEKSNVISISNEKTGFITVWSSNKKDEGRTIFIHEIDKNGNIYREVETKIIYAKKDKDLVDMDQVKVPFNTSNKLLFFGEISSTPFGDFPLYPKIDKDCMEPLRDGESRLVKIQKYRD